MTGEIAGWCRASAAVCLAVACSVAAAAEFSVTPTRLELDRKTKSGVIVVANDDVRPLRVQLQAMEWRQSPEGEDQYEDTNDLVYFPRLALIEPKQSQVFRVAIRLPATDREKTYRVFVEELPDAQREKPAGTGVSIAVRFGVPVFVAPVTPAAKLAIESAAVSQGKLNVQFNNPGNRHVRIQTVRVSAGEKFSKEAAGWYVLAGARRQQVVDIPNDVCRGAGALQIEVVSDAPPLRQEVPVSAAQCAR